MAGSIRRTAAGHIVPGWSLTHLGLRSGLGQVQLYCEQDDGALVSSAGWIAELSMRARTLGDCARADHLLLLAWTAHDVQDVSVQALARASRQSDQAGTHSARAPLELW